MAHRSTNALTLAQIADPFVYIASTRQFWLADCETDVLRRAMQALNTPLVLVS